MVQALRSTPTGSTEARALVERIFRSHPHPHLSVRFWDGEELRFPDPDFTLVFRDPETFWRLFTSRDPALFGDAYVRDRIDIEGDVEAAVRVGSYIRDLRAVLPKAADAGPAVVPRASHHSALEDRRDVRAHYDLPDDFFDLFLDARRVYSCAYFADAAESLERAQERKLDLVCRKLRLRPGERFLDVGCGWGALLLWAAEHYGVEGHGITLSRHQAEYARRRVEEAGLSDRVRIDERHYEDLAETAYDKIASVGMYEHVGIARYPAYFSCLKRALQPGGLLLNHGITVMADGPANAGGEFIYRYVFPGGELDEVSHTQSVMTEAGFEILDVQSLRPHYALTLREWYRRFRRREAQAARLVPPEVVRTWRLYLTGCAQAFEEGIVSVYQILAGRRDGDGSWALPLRREELLGEPDA